MPALNRYIVQDDMYSCGPTALYNFLVWAKLRPRRRDMTLLRKLCFTRPNSGTDFNSILNFMAMFAHVYDVRYFQTRSIVAPLDILRAGGSFMMVFDSGDANISHIAFCRGIKNGKISIINAVSGKKELLLTKQQFKNVLLNNSSAPYFLSIRPL